MFVSNPHVNPNIWATYTNQQKKMIADHYGCRSIGHFEETYMQLGNALVASEYGQFISEAGPVAIDEVSVDEGQIEAMPPLPPP